MKFGMNLLLWTAEVTDKHYPLLVSLKDMGYDGVEVPLFSFDTKKCAELGTMLKRIGLESTAVTICTGDENPISPRSGVRRAGLDRIKSAIDCTVALGGNILCGPFHSALGLLTGAGPTKNEWEWGKDVLHDAGDHAEEAGITLAVEALNRYECYFLNSVGQVAQFCHEIDHPNVGAMYDTFHAHIEEKCPHEAVEKLRNCLAHVHISENDRSTPGEGQVDFQSTFDALTNIDYDGWLTIEAFGMAMPQLAAATKIWRKMYQTENMLAKKGLHFMKSWAAPN